MAKNECIARYTEAELAQLVSRTDWTRVDATTSEEIERQALEDDGPLPAGWERTITAGIPTAREDVQLRLDEDVLRWFRAQGPNYPTLINAVLRSFVRTRTEPDPEKS